MELVEPNIKYLISFRKYINEYKELNDELYMNIYHSAYGNFKNYIRLLELHAEGRRLPKGWTAYKTYWLVDYHEVIGVIRIRYKALRLIGNIGYDIRPFYRGEGYGNKILELGLEKAKNELKMEKVFISCKRDNIRSKKIIIKNGGKLYKKLIDKEKSEYIMYVIKKYE